MKGGFSPAGFGDGFWIGDAVATKSRFLLWGGGWAIAERRRKIAEEEAVAELRLKEEEEFLGVILGIVRYVWSV
jgi:hypothetical protein